MIQLSNMGPPGRMRLARGSNPVVARHQLRRNSAGTEPSACRHTQRAESAEALLRWKHPTLGTVSPGEFMAVAEATDLIQPLTEWTIVEALSQIRRWHQRGLAVRVAVNLSARILQDTAFPARLRTLIEASGIKPRQLELEITESAMMQDSARALGVVRQIHDLGVMIAIDDYGTGFSSLGYLRDLRDIRGLKLDRSFVTGMDDDPRAAYFRQMEYGLYVRMALLAMVLGKA